MNFKKNALRTVVAAAGLSGAVAASAGTWTASVGGNPVFATELFGTGSTVEIEPNNASYAMATTLAANATVNIVYTLTGATWGTALTGASLTYTSTGTGVVSKSLVDGGANTDTTATFRVTVAIGTSTTDTFSLDYTLRGVTGLGTASTTNGPTLSFSITDVLGKVDTDGAAGVVASSIEGVTTSTTANASPTLIDVSNGSTQFTTGGASTLSFNAGTFNITDNAGAANGVEDNGTTVFALNANDVTLTSTTATLTGDFSASIGVDTDADGNSSEGEGVTITGCRTLNATTLTATTATFAISAADTATIGGAATACTVNINVDGTTVIPEQTPSLALAIDYATAGYADEARTTALAKIAKDGSTVPVNLLLNPTGAYDNFIRVSNTGSVAGKVFITVYTDAGASASYTLIDNLAANGSSDLISVDTIYASAQAADATFDVGTGKLRASVTGEFSGVNVQNISTSTDGTTFFTF